MAFVFCPYCNTKNNIDKGAPIGALPPTGGDYEWQESDSDHTCKNCQNTFKIRIRTSLDSGEALTLNSSPKPILKSIIWYALATVQKNIYGSMLDTFEVMVFCIAQTKTEIDSILDMLKKSGKHKNKHILKITSQGYLFLNGEYIPEPSYYQNQINYQSE